MIDSIYFIIFSSFLSIFVFCVEQPKISIDFVRYADNFKWIKQTADSDSYIKYSEYEYMISLNTVGLNVVCRAPYPVYWKLDFNAEDDAYTMMYDIFTYMEREVPDEKFHDKSSYKYLSSVVLQMAYKQFTGNYSCVSAMDNNVQKSVYFYFENVSPPFLAQAGKTLNVSAYNKDSIVLPCNVYNQEVQVYLFRESIRISVPYNITDWIEVPISNSVSYDPKVGFTLAIQDISDVLGRFKCATNETEDFVFIDVLKENRDDAHTQFESNKLEGSAKYYWNTTNKQFYCCSNDKDYPPKIIMTYCDNHVFCQLQRQILSAVSHNETVDDAISRQRHSSGNCSFRKLWEDTSYVLRCKGEGISLLTELHPTLKPINQTIGNGPYHPYGYNNFDFDMHTNWEQQTNFDHEVIIKWLPSTVIYEEDGSMELPPLAPTPRRIPLENGTLAFYVGETASFLCHFSEYFLSRGNMWAVKMKNGTINIIYNVTTHWKNPNSDEFYPYRKDNSKIEMILTISKDMQSVLCYAPLWNSADWVSASLPFETKEPTFPKIEGKDLETVYWTLNETNMILQCSTGEIVPFPSFTWTKDGSVILTDNMTYTVTKGNESTSLKVHVVSHEIHGQYVCLASNIAGKTNRTFNVFVAERHSLGLIIGGSASVIVFLSALISFLWWKMNTQTNSLVNLRANVYAGH